MIKTVNFEIPGNLVNLKLDKNQEQKLQNKLKAQYLAELAEQYALMICEKKFNQTFYRAKNNQKGWDIISADNSIKIEIKQTSCLGTKTHLSIGSTYTKKNLCTHIMILDFYNNEKISIIPQNEFFKSNFHGKKRLWRWSKDYNVKNQPKNTSLFLKYEIKL